MSDIDNDKPRETADTAGYADKAHLRFDVKPELALDVRSTSGDLHLSEGPTGACEVRLTTQAPDPASRLEIVECHYGAASNQLVVDTKANRAREHDSSDSVKSTLARLFSGFGHDVDVEVVIPQGTGVKFRTASGDLSGKVTVRTLTMSSASGDASVNGVDGLVDVKSASGDVHLGSVSGDLSVQSVSGDVVCTISSPVDAKINTVSGNVVLAVGAGLLLSVDASTMSGDLSSEIALDHDGAEGTGEATLHLKVRTVSGDLTLRRV